MLRITVIALLIPCAQVASATENAVPLYLEAAGKLSRAPHLVHTTHAGGFAALRPAEAAKVAGWLNQRREALAILRKARAIPRCRFARDWSKGFGMEMPNLASLKNVVRIACVRAEMLAHDGRDAEAREALADAIGVAEVWREDPVLISQLVRVACHGMVLTTMRRCMGRAPLAWARLLPPVRRFDRMFCKALITDADFLDEASRDPEMLAKGFDGTLSFLQRKRAPEDARRCARLLRKTARLMERPYRVVREELEAVDRESKRGPRWMYPVTPLLMPATLTVVVHRAKLKARMALYREVARFLDQQRRTGRFPATAVGIDPFSGEPLRVDAKKKKLYSVGPDGVDDGGRLDDLALGLAD